MKSVAILAAAAGLAGSVSAHVHHHEHLHKRTTTAASSTSCPQWTGGRRPPAYLTNLPLSIQTELPSWTGAPPPDWCSGTAWMQSYVSCATVYESCKTANATTTSSTYSGSINATTTGSTTWTRSTGSPSGGWTGSVSANWTGTGTWSSRTHTGTGTWSSDADPTSTGTWSSWADPSSTGTWSSDADSTSTGTWSSWADPTSTGTWSSDADPTSTATWSSWADPSSTGTWSSDADPTSTGTWSSWADPTSTGTWGSWVDPASTSTSTAWGSWVDPASQTTSTSSSTAWGSWVDPASTSTSTAWGTWADPAGSSASSVCGCTTVIVTVTGDPTWIPDSPTTTYSTVTVVPTPASSASTTTWGSWSDSSSATSSAAWSTSSSSSSGNSTGGSGNAAISPAGSLWAITYSPYTASGGCKDEGTITADITAIKALGFTTVRIYSTDCSGLEYVGATAKTVGLKLILGVFIEASGVSGAQPQVSEIVSWGQWDLVEMIIVGNEALFNNYLSVSDLAGFISSSKWAFSNAGYTGPVTTTEPLNIWQSEGSSLCSSIDVVAANIHAFFNAQTTASQAGPFIQSELAILDTICSGKSTYVVESGWPHAGEANGLAIPGTSEQATALSSIQQTCGAQVVFFTYEDDLWKAPGAFDVEQSWGCASVFKDGSAW